MFEVIVGAVAVIAGIMAGISGAGIGSVLTPLLSFQIDVGAWIHSFLSNYILTLLFASLLILAGLTSVFGLTKRLKFGRWTGWVAGAISGFLGGMVGEQGGFVRRRF